MEALVSFVILLAVIFAFQIAKNLLTAVGRTAVGKGSLKENLEDAFKGVGALEARLVDEPLEAGGAVKALQVKGLFPVDRQRRIGFVTSVLDMTSGEPEPVVAMLGECQEQETRAYQRRVEIGPTAPGHGFREWTRTGVVIPQILQTAHSGKRKLIGVLRLIDLDINPKINLGFNEPKATGLLWQRELSFDFVAEGKGYLELMALREEALALCLKLATAVAMTDRALGDGPGYTLKKWIEKQLATTTGETRDRLKSALNQAFKDGYAQAKRGDLDRGALIARLKEIGDVSLKYQAIELCFEVMTAGNVLQSQQAREVEQIARSLELDYAEFTKIRDRSIVNIDPATAKEIPVEELLGLDPKWSVEQIKQFLRDEWYKWNNRLNALPDGPERETAQRMLDAITAARKKHG